MRHGKNLLAVIAAVAMLLFGGSVLAAVNTLALPEALRIIDEEAFYGDMSISKVVLPEGTTEIRARAFAGSALEEINLPESLSFIADDAFDGCSELVVTAQKGSYAYEWAVGCGLIDPSAEPTVPDGLSYEIADNQVTITDYSGNAAEIAIPETIEGYPVTSIGDWAFFHCSSLRNITLPDGLTSIGDYAFNKCDSLTNIMLPDGLTSIGDYAFNKCDSLTNIMLPDGLTSIGDNAFDGCSSLTSINIPSGVTSIGGGAFRGCSNLTSINIPSGVTSIGSYAFVDCSSLTSINIPSGVTSIGHYAFRNCSSLTNISIPSGVMSIGSYAFADCSSLTSINIPSGVTSIGSDAFYKCSSLISINIPSGVTSIGDYTFYKCSSLTSINIPSGVTSIGNYAFNSCSSLTSISIPSGVTSIGSDAFNGCSKITLCVYKDTYSLRYAQSYSIPYICVSAPGVPDEFYKIVNTYSINGKIYHEVNLLKDYNGVSVEMDSSGFQFFLDAERRVVTDADTLSKLFTLSIYAPSEYNILQHLEDWKSTSQMSADVALDFMGDEQLAKTLGNGFATGVKVFALGHVSGLLDLPKYCTDMGNIVAFGTLANIQTLSNHLWEMIDWSLNYSTRNANGYYDYDKVVMMLEYYRYCALYYDAVQSLCMPIVDDILSKYTADWQIGLDRLLSFFLSFVDTAVSGVDYPFLESLVSMLSAVIDGDVEGQELLKVLLSSITSDPVSMTVNSLAGSMLILGDVFHIDPHSRDELIAVFFCMTPEVLEGSQLQSTYLRLAQ